MVRIYGTVIVDMCSGMSDASRMVIEVAISLQYAAYWSLDVFFIHHPSIVQKYSFV